MIKGCINPQDIPTSPKSLWSAFGAPTRGDVELLSEKYNLAVGKPLEKVVTLGLLYELRDFGQRLDDWRRRLNSEYIFIPALVDSACVWPSWLPFGGNRGHTPVNEAAWEMAEKWAKVEEREKELHVWLDEASVLVGRAEELLGCSSITVGGVRGPGAMKRRRYVAARPPWP